MLVALADTSSAVLSGPLLIATPIAITAGALSFFSPCCLPLVPGYLGLIAGSAGAETEAMASTAPARVGASSVAAPSSPTPNAQARFRAQQRTTLCGSALFVLGFSAVFTSYGALFGGLGTLLIQHQVSLTRVLGVATIAFGLMFMGAFHRAALSNRTWRPVHTNRTGLAGAPVLGVLFGLGWTPCIGPTLAAVLTLSANEADAGRGAFLSFAYSLGLGIPFVIAAWCFQRGLRAFGFARAHARSIMRTGGAVMVLLGILQVSGLWNDLIRQTQGMVSGFVLPL